MTLSRYFVNARLALLATAVLLAGGAVGSLAFEWRGILAPVGWSSRLLTAGFLAVTAQSTTGFNTVDTGALLPGTRSADVRLTHPSRASLFMSRSRLVNPFGDLEGVIMSLPRHLVASQPRAAACVMGARRITAFSR